MTDTNLILRGLAQQLHAAGAGTWSPDGAYAEGTTAIVLYTLPAQPERVICLTPYVVSAEPGLVEQVLGIQVKFRAAQTDPSAIGDMRDAVFQAWQALTGQVGGGAEAVRITQLLYQSGTPLRPDTQGRPIHVENYYCWRNVSHPRLE